jgi:hypothetical protein
MATWRKGRGSLSFRSDVPISLRPAKISGMSQNDLNLPRPHVPRMPATMKFYIAPDPLQIRLFRSQRRMPSTNPFPRHFEQARPLGHIILLRVQHDTETIWAQGNQEDAPPPSAICTAFDAIHQPFRSSNESSNKSLGRTMSASARFMTTTVALTVASLTMSILSAAIGDRSNTAASIFNDYCLE